MKNSHELLKENKRHQRNFSPDQVLAEASESQRYPLFSSIKDEF
jgi:hypothetical protein